MREENTNKFTSTLSDLFVMATMSTLILAGLFIIIALEFKIKGIFVKLFTLWIICIVVTVIKYYNFTVIREKSNIKISYGLMNKVEQTFPVDRIQSLIIIEGVFKKPLGYFSLKVQTVGYGKNKSKSVILCPIAKSKMLNKFFENILPEMNVTYDLRISPGKALKEFLFFRLVGEVILIGLMDIFVPYAYYGFLLIPILLFWHYLKFKDNGLYYGSDFVIMRYRQLARKTVIILKDSIQSFEKVQNIWERREAIAKYKVTIARGSLGKSYVVGYINENNYKSSSTEAVINL